MSYPRIASFKSAQQFTDRLKELDLSIPFDDQVIRGEDSPLADSLQWEGRRIGNRFCILPM